MERPTASLTYKGSISDAIVEAQKQKKLFLVYISGEDDISTRLEQSTLGDKSAAESVSKYCIFLHLVHGNLDTLQFSAIYPQKSFPSITAVGYNGVMLWQHEGYVSAEDFAGNIEKAWASLHFQETAASLLTAALAAKKPDTLNLATEGSSSALDVASTSEGKSASDSELQAEQMVAKPIDDNETEHGLETSSQSSTLNDVKRIDEEQTSVESNSKEEVSNIIARDPDVPIAVKEEIAPDKSYAEASPVSHVKGPERSPDSKITTTILEDEKSKTEDIVEAIDKSYAQASLISPGKAPEHSPDSELTTAAVEEKSKTGDIVEAIDHSNAVKSDDIHLNIRLPSGSSLQRKFTKTDTLRSVKSYVDENQNSEIGSYDLAIPYPRKVYGEQDMNSTLSELGFTGRQTLIVVPHRRASIPQRVTSSFQQNTTSTINSTDASGGYFGFVKRALSYMNPFSYLGGSGNPSNSEPPPSNSFQQYRPNQGHQLSRGESSNSQFGLNQQNPSSGENAGEMRRRASRPFGSNIHTLRHDEDDLPSSDRNTFWNGNSTEFGGDDKK